MPGQHVLPILSARVGGSKQHLSSTSFVTKAGRDPSSIGGSRAKQSRSTAVPLLIQPNGEVLTDSWEIANSSGLEPVTEPSIMKMYDEELGPLTRQYAYSYLLRAKHRKSWDRLLCFRQGILWLFLYFFIGGFIHSLMSKLFGCGNATLLCDCENKLGELLERISKERLPKKSKYINGDKISVEDIALCTLAAPLLLPPKYCGGTYFNIFAEVESSDEEFRERLEYYRNTDVGKYVMHFYEKHRDVKTV